MEKLMAEYLANELSEKKRSAFELQLIEDEQLRNEFEDYLNLWHESDGANLQSFDADEAWAGMSIQKTPLNKTARIAPKPSYTLLKIAATLLILLVAGYFLSDTVKETFSSSDNSIKTLSEISTGAEMKEFELPDGSLIKLNANSTLTYEQGFGDAHRNLTLVGGANFDVTRNEDLPFIISAEKSEVEVLGTSFDVNAYPGKNILLNVTEGQVRFSSNAVSDQNGLVKAGERAQLSQDGTTLEQSKMTDNNYAAWWTRKLVFEATSFEEVVEVLENTYWIDIEFSEALKGCALTSTFENLSIDQAFEVMKATLPQSQLIVLRTKENQIKLEGKACAN
ncbi:FecR family protein [Roseivirga sp.]|uniref:FecR family protein n=1 Tax=Roseivirga sp. TaxID=1964215 RepID=UPI003B8CF157